MIAVQESTGHVAEARSGWQAALDRWPGEPVTKFGMANVEFAPNKVADAENIRRQLPGKIPNPVSVRKFFL